jgi:hypothetical protein
VSRKEEFAIILAVLIGCALCMGGAYWLFFQSGFIKLEDDYSGRGGHNIMATEIQELRKDVWAVQTSIAPKDQ